MAATPPSSCEPICGNEELSYKTFSLSDYTDTSSLDRSSPWHDQGARPFLSDLGNFIGLGCLAGALLEQDLDIPVWTEVWKIPDDGGLRPWTEVLDDFLSAGWTRVFLNDFDHRLVLRIYVLAEDAGHRYIPRYDKSAKSRYGAWRSLIAALDTNPDTWEGVLVSDGALRFDMWATAEEGSLFWMFNNTPSPEPRPENISNIFRKHALADLLDPRGGPTGMRTALYPYQRRSAGLMLERESSNELYLDPRFEKRTAADGTLYYYDARDFSLLRRPRLYEAGKGGILAETMGLGKTVITLALIVATRGFLPRVPIEYARPRLGARTMTLVDLCVSAALQHAVPWKTLLNDRQLEAAAVKKLERTTSSYKIPQIPIRFNRTTSVPPPKTKIMASTTIVVVPRNLCSQWQLEIDKHVRPGILNVLVMDDLRKDLPPPDQLRQYDVILFSRNRFEQESRDGSDEQGRRFSKTPLSCHCPYIGATRKRDCTCLRTDDLYSSPLKELHFLRIVIDEGHSFSSTVSIAAIVAQRLVTADHRWVVSGTPAKDLLGVEMDLFSSDTKPSGDVSEEEHRAMLLCERKDFNVKEDVSGSVKNLGSLISHFLQMKPWYAGQTEQQALWEEYIYRHEDSRRKTYSGFSRALRRTLEAVVIKTRPEDVERDIELPPLIHETVKLQPSFYDVLTFNLFIFQIISNAITSERRDQDYMFHKDQTKSRIQLISNLRQSAFFWSGITEEEAVATIGNSERYLKKEGIICSEEDKELLRECIENTKATVNVAGWKEMTTTHELGVFIKDWPQESAEQWSFEGLDPILTGATQVGEAQRNVHERLAASEDDFNLVGEGIKALVRARAKGRAETLVAEGRSKSALAKSGIAGSSVKGEPVKKRTAVPRQVKAAPGVKHDDQDCSIQGVSRKGKRVSQPAPLFPEDPSRTLLGPIPKLPSSCPLHRTRLVGTTSAKASHLLSEVLRHHRTEKILIFYSSDNSAYYLSQLFELVHVPYLIYARTLPAATKSAYIVRFNSHAKERVMLMDVAQAAFGLNLSSASRVYFVNPVCRPVIEAQAIKRAHRIGQDKPVTVQTLVLAGTVEEGMYERGRRMSRAEHREAKVLEDEEGVKGLVMNARPMRLDWSMQQRMAKLQTEEKLFCRPGWEMWKEGEWFRRGKEIAGKRRADEMERQAVGEGKRVTRDDAITAGKKNGKGNSKGESEGNSEGKNNRMDKKKGGRRKRKREALASSAEQDDARPVKKVRTRTAGAIPTSAPTHSVPTDGTHRRTVEKDGLKKRKKTVGFALPQAHEETQARDSTSSSDVRGAGASNKAEEEVRVRVEIPVKRVVRPSHVVERRGSLFGG